MSFTLEDLVRIAREETGDPRLDLRDDMSAADVAAWDSLNHTIITMAIGAEYGVELQPKRLGEARNFGELVAMVNRAIDAGASAS
jgi:acyl carrier protein